MSDSRTCPNGHPVASGDTSCPHCDTVLPGGLLPPAATQVLPAIPGYEILEHLGRGGMGVVYKARQVRLNRVVAIKMIKDDVLAGKDEIARFRAEAESVARLQHPHVVQIFEVGEHQSRPFFSLEFVEGGTLAQRLGKQPQPPHEAARIVATLARTMEAAHAQGVIHRDLKPGNILLTGQGQPKISDFGLAKQLGSSESLTNSGAVVGTPAYMAPEQALGKSSTRPVGPAADVYALGAILYEMLTGGPPFRGVTALEVLQQVVTRDPVPPRTLQPTVPRALELICLKCLEKAPSRRYPTAAALADDLENWLAGKQVSARPAAWPRRLGHWLRQNRAVSAALALLLLGIVAVGFYAWYASRTAEVARADLDDLRKRQAQPPPPGPKQMPYAAIYQRALKGTGWLAVQTEKTGSTATCILVDPAHRLVLTTLSVAPSDGVYAVLFPLYTDGKPVTDREAYHQRLRKEGIAGKLVASDPRRDLALLQLERLPDGLVPIPWSKERPQQGDLVHMVSNLGPSGGLWTYTSGTLSHVQQASENQPARIETSAMMGPGSGGAALLNARGELIGLAQAVSRGLIPFGIFLDRGEIETFLGDYFRTKGIAWKPPAAE